MPEYEFTLYVSYCQRQGKRAVESVKQACARHLCTEYQLNVVDVDETPEAAERGAVLATPTLVVERPLPQRRLIGCFEQLDVLARVMGIADDSTMDGSGG